MEKRKKSTYMIVAFGLLSVLLASLAVQTLSSDVLVGPSASPQKPAGVAPATPATAIPGVIYTGTYIRIGLNNGGTFGVSTTTPPTNPGVGFQFPIGPQYESLAIWWWGEGYVLNYKVLVSGVWQDRVAYWWPDLGWPPPAGSRIVPIYAKQTRNDNNRAIWEVKVQTVDKVLNVTFVFSFPKPQKYVLLETTIKNTGAMGKVRDLLYKRIVDWDIHQDTGNMWTSDSHAAYASYYNATLGATYVMSVAGYTPTVLTNIPAYVDLYAWEDIPGRPPGSADIQTHHAALLTDGNAGIYYDLGGDLSSGSSKKVVTVYQAGWNWLTGPAVSSEGSGTNP